MRLNDLTLSEHNEYTINSYFFQNVTNTKTDANQTKLIRNVPPMGRFIEMDVILEKLYVWLNQEEKFYDSKDVLVDVMNYVALLLYLEPDAIYFFQLFLRGV